MLRLKCQATTLRATTLQATTLQATTLQATTLQADGMKTKKNSKDLGAHPARKTLRPRQPKVFVHKCGHFQTSQSLLPGCLAPAPMSREPFSTPFEMRETIPRGID